MEEVKLKGMVSVLIKSDCFYVNLDVILLGCRSHSFL